MTLLTSGNTARYAALARLLVRLGQLLSTRFDLLPAASTSALTRLQGDVAPFPFETVYDAAAFRTDVSHLVTGATGAEADSQAGSVLGAALMMQVPSGHHIFGYPAIAMFFFLFAVLARVALAVWIVLTDRKVAERTDQQTPGQYHADRAAERRSSCDGALAPRQAGPVMRLLVSRRRASSS